MTTARIAKGRIKTLETEGFAAAAAPTGRPPGAGTVVCLADCTITTAAGTVAVKSGTVQISSGHSVRDLSAGAAVSLPVSSAVWGIEATATYIRWCDGVSLYHIPVTVTSVAAKQMWVAAKVVPYGCLLSPGYFLWWKLWARSVTPDVPVIPLKEKSGETTSLIVFPPPHADLYIADDSAGVDLVRLGVGGYIVYPQRLSGDGAGIVEYALHGQSTEIRGVSIGTVTLNGPDGPVRVTVGEPDAAPPPPPSDTGIPLRNSDGWTRGVLTPQEAESTWAADMTATCRVVIRGDSPQVAVDDQIRVGGEWFRVRKITRKREGRGIRETLHGEGIHTVELGRTSHRPKRLWKNATINNVLGVALAGTGWTVGTVTVGFRPATWEMAQGPALACLSQAREVYGGDVVFDTKRRVVSWWAQRHDWSYRLWAPGAGLLGMEITEDGAERATKVVATREDNAWGVSWGYDDGGIYERHTYIRVRNGTTQQEALRKCGEVLHELRRPRVTADIEISDDQRTPLELHSLLYVHDSTLKFRGMLKVTEITRDWLRPWDVRVEASSTLWADGVHKIARERKNPFAWGGAGVDQVPGQISGYTPLAYGLPDLGVV